MTIIQTNTRSAKATALLLWMADNPEAAADFFTNININIEQVAYDLFTIATASPYFVVPSDEVAK